MPLQLKTKIRSGYVVAFLLLLLSYLLIFFTIQRLVKGTQAVTHSYSVINKLETLRSLMTDAETGARGYVITKDQRSLEPYRRALIQIPVLKKQLWKELATDEQVPAVIDSLDSAMTRKLEYMRYGIEVFRKSNFVITEDILIAREPAIKAMDSVRSLIDQLVTREEKIMNEKSETLSGTFSKTDVLAIMTLVIAMITVIFALITYNQENKAREKADANALQHQQSLEKN